MESLQNTFISEPAVRNGQASKGLAVTQILLGFLVMGLEITGLATGSHGIDYLVISGAGTWNGILFIATGITGLVATRSLNQSRPRRTSFTVFTTLSVVSCLFAGGMFVYSLFAFMMLYKPCTVTLGGTHSACVTDYDVPFLVIRLSSTIIYAIQFVLFIVTSAYGCCNVCRANGPTVQYHQIEPPQHNFHSHLIHSYATPANPTNLSAVAINQHVSLISNQLLSQSNDQIRGNPVLDHLNAQESPPAYSAQEHPAEFDLLRF